MKLAPAKALRLCAMLCTMLCLYVSAQAIPPEYKVTLKANQQEMKTVLRAIEDQTGLYFMFNTNMIQMQEKVSIHVQSVKLEDVLQQLFASRGISWSIIQKAIVLKNAAATPAPKKEPVMRAVSGTVSDENGSPLPGATLLIKGTNIGTLSNANGGFVLPGVPASATVLLARFTGFKPLEMPIGDDPIKVTLQRSVSNLDETVVVAYGTTTERSTTGAISVVKGEQIQTLPNRSFDKSLQGLVPGLRISGGTGQPGGGLSNMVLRGISTGTEALGGSTVRNPLIVIDGVPVLQDPFSLMETVDTYTPVSNPLAQINPADIAEISVLKDAAAIALYGSKASNGVIVVTTKKGTVGKATFTFNQQTDFSSRPPAKIRFMDQQEYLKLLYETYRQTDPVRNTDSYIRADLFKKFPYRVNGPDTSFYDATDWKKLLYRDAAVTLANNLSISGGSNTQRYYINLEHTHQDGIARSTGFNRSSLRVNLDNKPANWIKLGVNSTLSYTTQSIADNTEFSSSGIGLTDALSPLIPNRLDNGNYNLLLSWGANAAGSLTTQNPAAANEFNFHRTKAHRALASLTSEISFLRYFSFNTLLGVDFMQTETRKKNSPMFRGPAGFGSLSNYDVRRSGIVSTNTLNFNKLIGRFHHISALLSQEARIQEENNSQISAKATDAYTNPDLNDISSQGYNRASAIQRSSSTKLLSQFGQLEYNFREKYYLSGSWRRDGVSVFGSNNPWANYGSIGGAWIASSERFLQNITPVVNFLKFRGSIGLSGNTAALNSYMAYQQLYNFTYLGKTALVTDGSTPGNPSIEWEKTSQWDAGMQMGLFNNRIYLEADYYYKFTKNLIFSAPLQSFTGFLSVNDNIGDMRNSGIELSLKADVLRNTRLKWNLSANWSRNSNKLIKANGQHFLTLINPLMAIEVGREFSSFYLPVWAGANPDDGKPQWLNAEGKPTGVYTEAAKQFQGQSQPKGFGAVTNTLSWKGLSCLFQFQYQYGGQVYNEQYRNYYSDGQRAYMNAPADVANRWQKPGDVSDNPVRLIGNTQGGFRHSTRYLYKSDYIRLQLVSLSWNFPKHLTDRLLLRSLRVFGQGSNLALWKPASGIDPDQINPGGAVAFSYPNARTWTIGLNTSF